MDRRKALALAGTIALTLTAAGTATAANLGLLAAESTTPVGQLDARNVASLTDQAPPTTQTVTTVTEVQVVEDVITVPIDDHGVDGPAPGGAVDDRGGSAPGHDDDGPDDDRRPPTAPAPTTAPAPVTAPTPTTAFDDHGDDGVEDDHSADRPDDHGDDGEEHELDD